MKSVLDQIMADTSTEDRDRFPSDEDFDSNDSEASSESSSDVDARLEEDEVFDEEFLKCYSALKRKDQKIYNKDVRFFNENLDSESEPDAYDQTSKSNATSKSATQPKMTILDHQLSCTNDLEEPSSSRAKIDLNQPVSKSFYEKELEEIKKSIEQVNDQIDSDSDESLLQVKTGNQPRRKKTIESILDRLEETDEDVCKLKEMWNNPKELTEEDKFLRDYILNKRYLPQKVDADKSDDDDERSGYFSKNLDELPDCLNEDGAAKSKSDAALLHHSDEKNFDTIARIPRNSTKTIRDMVEKQEKKEKRLKKAEKKMKRKKGLKDADCEDVVGDMATRFHYRETEPNDYGLSAEELLMATDEELDQWVNIHDAIAYRTAEEEKAQKEKFEAMRNDLELKKKIFKSIYGEPEGQMEETETKSSKRKRKHMRASNSESSHLVDERQDQVEAQSDDKPKSRGKKKRRGVNHKKFAASGVAPDRLLAYGLSKSKLKKSRLL